MPWPTYTERFVYAKGPVAMYSYIVPWGMRAVVKHVSMVNPFSEAGVLMQARVGGLAIESRYFLASETSRQLSGTWVAYGGEAVEAYIGSPTCEVAMAGFLFDDPTGRSAPPPPAQSADETHDPAAAARVPAGGSE